MFSSQIKVRTRTKFLFYVFLHTAPKIIAAFFKNKLANPKYVLAAKPHSNNY